MTLPRQGFYAALAAGLLLVVSAPTLAAGGIEGPRGQGVEGREYIGPPTAEEVAAAEAAAKPAPPVVQPQAAKTAPAWLSARPAPKAATGKSAIPPTGRMVGLLIVLGTLGIAALYFKRRGKGEGKLMAKPKRLSVLSSTRIGPKAHAVVISVAGRQMLLGVTDSSVKRLAFIEELEDESEREDSREALPARRPALQSSVQLAVSRQPSAVSEEQAPSRSFASLLKGAFKKREPASDADAASVLAAETQDVVGEGVGGRLMVSNVRVLDVEGQAQGLVRRLSGRA